MSACLNLPRKRPIKSGLVRRGPGARDAEPESDHGHDVHGDGGKDTHNQAKNERTAFHRTALALTGWAAAQREIDKPRQGVVAITLHLLRHGAVGFIDWLGRTHVSHSGN